MGARGGMLGLKCKMPPTVSCVWTLGPLMVVLLWEAVAPLTGVAQLKETGHWGQFMGYMASPGLAWPFFLSLPFSLPITSAKFKCQG